MKQKLQAQLKQKEVLARLLYKDLNGGSGIIAVAKKTYTTKKSSYVGILLGLLLNMYY